MARIDGWTDQHVDYAIRLLVLAEALALEAGSPLYQEIKQFLSEMA